jgi:hypothetical protein
MFQSVFGYPYLSQLSELLIKQFLPKVPHQHWILLDFLYTIEFDPAASWIVLLSGIYIVQKFGLFTELASTANPFLKVWTEHCFRNRLVLGFSEVFPKDFSQWLWAFNLQLLKCRFIFQDFRPENCFLSVPFYASVDLKYFQLF